MTKKIYTQKDIDNNMRYMYFYDKKMNVIDKRLIPEDRDLVVKLESEGWAKHPTQAKQKSIEQDGAVESSSNKDKGSSTPADQDDEGEPEKKGRGRPRKNDQ